MFPSDKSAVLLFRDNMLHISSASQCAGGEQLALDSDHLLYKHVQCYLFAVDVNFHTRINIKN